MRISSHAHGEPPASVYAIPVAVTYVRQVEGVETRLTLLWFLQADPRECWEAYFADLDAPVREAGLGRVELVAPFVPTVPGTDTYVDRLR